VTTGPNADLLGAKSRCGRRAYASPALLRILAAASLVVGLVAAFYGVAHELNGATRAGAPVAVSVQISDLGRLQVRQTTTAGSETSKSSWLQAGVGQVTLHAPGSTVAEWLASRGGGAMVGLCMGFGALFLRRLLLSIGRGQPFQRGNAARIAGIAGLIVVATLSAAILRYVAARLVLDRLGLGGPGSSVTAHLTISIVPLLLALFLLAFAEAFRQGTQLAKDAEGLV
jgi:hypothetical protein